MKINLLPCFHISRCRCVPCSSRSAYLKHRLRTRDDIAMTSQRQVYRESIDIRQTLLSSANARSRDKPGFAAVTDETATKSARSKTERDMYDVVFCQYRFSSWTTLVAHILLDITRDLNPASARSRVAPCMYH